ncbi:Lrp/AsnC ligand binding domain-containing protein [Paraglaciecola marina]|uniref:Lrp/AsnC ligand binding domain-containing protein n=1 Tax=Paraglaciecola marina TaxID=2500157 RepID=UPI0010622AD6|nr:Lrp/AsnC ligand binding domain-containing protein [Paraglaciecola marina]
MKKYSTELDRIDHKILDMLQSNCRISNVELANQVNLSPTPCLERVKRLEKNGYIDKYVAHLNAKKLNAKLTAYMQVSVENSSTQALNQFNQQVRKLDEVIECSLVAGGFDYLLKIRVQDMDAYRKFLGGKFADIKGVTQTFTYVVMEEIKSTHIVPVETK